MTTFGAVLTRPTGMEAADRACIFQLTRNGEIDSGARRACAALAAIERI
jgi:hypothetical protein